MTQSSPLAKMMPDWIRAGAYGIQTNGMIYKVVKVNDQGVINTVTITWAFREDNEPAPSGVHHLDAFQFDREATQAEVNDARLARDS